MFDFVGIAEIEELDEPADVYDITVEGTHCFFAEGMLVHNCIGGPFAWDTMRELQDVQGPDLTASVLDDPARMEACLRRVGNTYDQLADAVGRDHVFAELQFNALPQQHIVNRVLLEFASRTGAQLSAAADSHYPRPELWAEREIYKMLARLNFDQIDPSKLPTDRTQLKCELYPKNALQMWEAYKQHSGGHNFYDDVAVRSAIERTHDIVHGMIGNIEPDVSVKLPTSLTKHGMTPFQQLIEMCKDGMATRGLLQSQKHIARLKHELGIIREIAQKKGTDFSLYFITMKAIVDVADKSQLVGCGRGSAAGSLINYVLGVTQVDPLKYGLIFERFLSPARAEWPDVDSDFADRDRLIVDLKERFGADSVLPVSNFNTFQLRSLIKDLGRLYSVPFDEVNELTRTVEAEVKPHVINSGENKSLFQLKYDDCVKHSPRFAAFMEKYPEVGSRIKVLYKSNKSIGRHAGGVLVADGLDKKMPVISVRGEFQTPWVEGLQDKFLGQYGFLKFDLLGLETLRIIQNAIHLILIRSGVAHPTWKDVKAWYDERLHPDKIDFTDQHVFENVYCAGRWAGIFQFTQGGAQKFVGKFQPKSIDDIAVATALYRPGPLAAKFDEKYLQAKANPGSVTYDHPALKEVLGYTHNTVVFQEQIMFLGEKLALMSLTDCDRLRKAIVKRSISGNDKNKGEVAELEEMFLSGAEKNGYPRAKALALYETLAGYASYAFNACCTSATIVDTYNKQTWHAQKKSIKDVAPGDLVRSRDEKTKREIFIPVKKRHSNGRKRVVEVTLTTGEKVQCTMDHKFRTVETREMLPLSEILARKLSIVVEQRVINGAESAESTSASA